MDPMSPPGDRWTRWKDAYQRARRRRGFRWGVDVAIMVAFLVGAGAWQTRGHLRSVRAPTAVLSTLSGERVSLESLRGKPVLLAFWAPWCTVCAAESQNLSWVRRLIGQRAHVVSVAASFDSLEPVRAYVRDHEVDYPVLLGDDALLSAFRVEVFPTVYVLDADGMVRRSATGYTTTLGLLWRALL
jgi:peroxiredoxin